MSRIIKTLAKPLHIRCSACLELNNEACDIYTDTLKIQGGYFSYRMPVISCPVCGTILKRYEHIDKENWPKFERVR